MKIKILILLAATVCSGCSNSNDEAKIEALSQKIDLVFSNQAAIENQLDSMPKTMANIGYFYHTNELNALYEYHTNAIAILAERDSDVEADVNAETRRVSVIMFTNFMSLESDTLNTINQVKLSQPDLDELTKEITMQDEVEQLKTDSEKIKLRLGITY